MRKVNLYKGILTTFCILSVVGAQLAFADDAGTYGAYSSNGFADGAITDVICDLFGLVGGSFGGILTVTAGFVAIVTAAFGSGKGITGLIATAVGAFAITSIVSLYFGVFSCGT